MLGLQQWIERAAVASASSLLGMNMSYRALGNAVGLPQPLPDARSNVHMLEGVDDE